MQFENLKQRVRPSKNCRETIKEDTITCIESVCSTRNGSFSLPWTGQPQLCTSSTPACSRSLMCIRILSFPSLSPFQPSAQSKYKHVAQTGAEVCSEQVTDP